jgi:phosphatidate cytidylyltransferase
MTVFAAREVLRKDHSVERLAFAALGLLLFGFLPAHLALLRALPLWGEKLTLLALVSTWAADTTAMFLGRALGRTKLAPFLSPNKTWEGAFAGFLACLACALAFNAVWPGLLGWGGALAFAAVMGGLGQLSGLLNSMIKRLNGAKDSGTLLPGHGGFIDRFDAYLLAAAAAYALARLLGA